MKWKEFADKVSPLLLPHETIGRIGFKYSGEVFKITSQWGSGDNRELVNLWAKKTNDKNSGQIFPFCAKEVDKLKFFKICDQEHLKQKRI